MSRLVLASGALALGVFGATPAAAAAQSRAVGECGFVPLGSVALVHTSVALFSTFPKDMPVSADVGCQLYLGHEITGEAYFSGTNVVAGWQLIDYLNVPGQRMCTLVDFTSDATPDHVSCAPIVDQVSCPVLGSLAPGVGPVAIDASGDVSVAGTQVWDCPPYV